MGLKSFLAKPFAAWEVRRFNKAINNPIRFQERIFKRLLENGRSTKFGKDHDFNSIRAYEDFKLKVPVQDYEGLKPYIELVKKGERDILWPGLPKYFGKTSGTTSGTKYIPITTPSINAQVKAARQALTYY
ncbi:MAG: GH3 auxin-responsive promoter family protein, partial [Bacteroidetes bacterium]|nr:GH3 auxin-responsive promoter family protein [Bacteroidota bacterium]